MRLYPTWRRCMVPLLVPLAACGGQGASGGSGYSVRDSAGVQIAENTAPQWKEGEAWTLGAEPGVEIGVVEGAPEYQLSEVTDALRLTSGEIVVANGGSQEIRFYDASGRYLRTVGGEGGGPGEFKGLSWIRQSAGDSLIVYDRLQQRLTAFDREGTLLGSTLLPLKIEDGYLSPVSQLGDGSLVVQVGHGLRPGNELNGVIRDSSTFTRYSLAGALLNPLVRLRGSEMFVKGDKSSVAVSSLIFGRSSLYTQTDARLFFADNDSYEIGVYSPAGKLERLIRRHHEPHAVTRAEFQAAREERVGRMGNSDFSKTFAQMLADMPIPATLPAFAGLEADADGNLWVQEYRLPGFEGSEWTVFDPEGRMLGSVSLPDHFRPMQFGSDFVLGVWTDDLDVQHVRMYALSRPG